jgi:hypothetical protein
MGSEDNNGLPESAYYQTDQMNIAGYIAGVLQIAPVTYGKGGRNGFRAVFPIPEEEGRRYEAQFMTSEAKKFDDAVLHFKRTTFGSKL